MTLPIHSIPTRRMALITAQRRAAIIKARQRRHEAWWHDADETGSQHNSSTMFGVVLLLTAALYLSLGWLIFHL